MESENKENNDRKALMVQFACGGIELFDRKRCVCYTVDNEDTDFQDCVYLKHPGTKVRTGVCYSPDAAYKKSFITLKFIDDIASGALSQASESGSSVNERQAESE